MSHAAPRETGRPRATGRPRGLRAIPLTQAEWQMFTIGERIAAGNPDLPVDPDLDFTLLHNYMTPRERRQASASELTRCVRWIRAGIMYGMLCHEITELRRG